MKTTKPNSHKPFRPLLFLCLLILFWTTVVCHDYFCHKHLHELCSPLHSFYDNPESFQAESFFGSLPPRMYLAFPDEKIHHDEFIKNIFHPPDLLS